LSAAFEKLFSCTTREKYSNWAISISELFHNGAGIVDESGLLLS
jgi:hypothetical protein